MSVCVKRTLWRVRSPDLLSGMTVKARVIGGVSSEGQLVVRVLRALLVDDLIGAPVSQEILIRGPHWELSLLLGHIGRSLFLRLYVMTLINELILRNFLHSMRVDDLVEKVS